MTMPMSSLNRKEQGDRIKAEIMNLEAAIKHHIVYIQTEHPNERERVRKDCILQVARLLERLLETTL
jgi:hypothetical protein